MTFYDVVNSTSFDLSRSTMGLDTTPFHSSSLLAEEIVTCVKQFNMSGESCFSAKSFQGKKTFRGSLHVGFCNFDYDTWSDYIMLTYNFLHFFLCTALKYFFNQLKIDKHTFVVKYTFEYKRANNFCLMLQCVQISKQSKLVMIQRTSTIVTKRENQKYKSAMFQQSRQPLQW